MNMNKIENREMPIGESCRRPLRPRGLAPPTMMVMVDGVVSRLSLFRPLLFLRRLRRRLLSPLPFIRLLGLALLLLNRFPATRLTRSSRIRGRFFLRLLRPWFPPGLLWRSGSRRSSITSQLSLGSRHRCWLNRGDLLSWRGLR